jgi:hypothetical protein
MPLMVPSALSVTPTAFGNDQFEYVYGAVPPVAVKNGSLAYIVPCVMCPGCDVGPVTETDMLDARTAGICKNVVDSVSASAMANEKNERALSVRIVQSSVAYHPKHFKERECCVKFLF